MTTYRGDGTAITLSKEAERRNLLEHGTKVCDGLSARNILQAAEFDIVKRGANQTRESNGDPKLPYGFPAKYVQKSDSAATLLQFIVDDFPPPKTVADRLLWGDAVKVREALALARGDA